MSAFARTFRSWPKAPQKEYFNCNGYPPPYGSGPTNGFSDGYEYPHCFDPGASKAYEHPTEQNMYGRLGNLDVDGFPTNTQMLAYDPPEVSDNNIHGTYDDPEQYFRTQFGLMEEDFIFQVRKALGEYMFKPEGDNNFKESKGYEDVTLTSFQIRELGGDKCLTCVMDFGSGITRYEQPSFGNFLVFFDSEGERYPVCVGMVIKDAKQTNEDYSIIRLHFDDPDFDESNLKNRRFYVLIPNDPFFLSYFCIYNALNDLHTSNKFSKFPMAPYILYNNSGRPVKPPRYLDIKTKYRIYGKDCFVLKKGDWPAKPNHLNKSQFTALKKVLTEELALVQGPPGTGKTYFGVELVKVLLNDNNILKWNPSRETPLLVICHSNHALDHFLEGIHKFTDSYVRVGLRCESEIIKPKCLVELVCRDIALNMQVDDDCTCEVIIKRNRKFVVHDTEGDEDRHARVEDSEEENEDQVCHSKYCTQPNSKCYCLPSLQKCLKQIDVTRDQVKRLTQGIVNFKILHFWGVIGDEEANWFEERKHEDGFLKWLGIDNIKGHKNGKWLETTYLLVNLQEVNKNIENLQQSHREKAKKLNDAKNVIVNIIEKFKRSSRESIVGDENNIFSLTKIDSRKIYVKWLDRLKYRLEQTSKELENKLYYNFWDTLPRPDRYDCMLKHLKSAHVVGLTSTGAAARRSTIKIDKKTGKEIPREGVLEKLASPIVILEEAAQILESHVTASLTINCKHLIMLGDHQQLKPYVSAAHLKKKFLDVSLFERLVKNKVVVQECLKHQNRMRPEIADLLRPHYYAELFDAPSTCKRDSIRGLCHNLFFLDHRVAEKSASGDNKGFWNPHELKMLLNLAKFLVTNGYLPSQITLISMYNEQRRRLIEERDKIPCLANMEITSVDGFQGKENEIILLSLVRSNPGGNIGFLKESNRICVALSRARSGLYITGDMRCLTKHCEMWRKVADRLNQKGSIGPVLNLTCVKHDVERPLSTEDWQCHKCSARRKKRQKKRNRHSNKKKS